MGCFSCRGTGQIRESVCPDCKGASQVATPKRQNQREKYEVRRAKINEKSLETADAHRQLWSGHEEAELMFFVDEGLPWDEIAVYFGRTVEACHQHRYELLWRQREGRNAERKRYKNDHRAQEPEYVPIPAGPDEDQWWSPTFYTLKREA